MSSHREAPETSQDPVADNTDVYAFVSPDKPDTVTLLANYVPFQDPPGGPNFYEFGDDVRYEINVSNAGKAAADLTFRFEFTTTLQNQNTFLYNTGPIASLTDPNWNKRQTYTLSMIKGGGAPIVLGSALACPPCNIGPRSTPNYTALAQAAIHEVTGGITVFAGQRAEGFYVDLGSVFDLLDLRPFENLHLISSPAAAGVDGTQGLNIHTLALQLPKTLLTSDGSDPTDVMSATSVIGVWATASRQMSRMYTPTKGAASPVTNSGPYVQVSRLANPLFNEVLIPLGTKDYWNSQVPSGDSQFASHVANPEVSTLLPTLYPGVFPNLAALNKKGTARADLEAILLTGLPAGVVPGFQNNTGTTQADMIRLNMAVPPTTSNPNPAGLVAGDAAGFPNGRRVIDDVVAVELRALAGLTYALVDKTYTPDAAAAKVTDGTVNTNNPYLDVFPYLGTPNDGFDSQPSSATLVGGSGTGSGGSSTTPLGAPQTGAGGASAHGVDRTELEVGAVAAAAALAVGAGAVRQLLKPAPLAPRAPDSQSDQA
jgi:hypothetical protein